MLWACDGTQTIDAHDIHSLLQYHAIRFRPPRSPFIPSETPALFRAQVANVRSLRALLWFMLCDALYSLWHLLFVALSSWRCAACIPFTIPENKMSRGCAANHMLYSFALQVERTHICMVVPHTVALRFIIVCVFYCLAKNKQTRAIHFNNHLREESNFISLQC